MIKKEPIKKHPAAKPAAKKEPSAQHYFWSTGGRKSAQALVRVFPRQGDSLINGKKFSDYFKATRNQIVARAALEAVGLADKITVTAKVHGGGLNAQADALRNGIAKALSKMNPMLKPALRRVGFVTRDARVVERKKYGLKKARRAPQWAKR